MTDAVASAEAKNVHQYSTKARPAREWYIQMDGLRFIAVMAVLVEHFAYFIGGRLHLGFFGVDLFFVISGFLITEGLLKDKRRHRRKTVFRKFYLKRFLRIFPIYYLLITLAYFLYPAFKEIAVWAFTYTINYYPNIGSLPSDLKSFGHLWSLAVEEQFYLFWPLIILITPRKNLFIILSVIFSVSVAWFIINQDYWGLPGRMYSLCFGAALAYFKIRFPEKYRINILKRFLFCLLAAVTVYFFDNSLGLSIFSFGLVYLSSNNAFKGILKKFLENKRVVYVGKMSYGVYLYHLPLGYLMTYLFFDRLWKSIDFSFFPQLNAHPWLVTFPLYTSVTLLVAHISYKYIERPILKYKDKIK